MDDLFLEESLPPTQWKQELPFYGPDTRTILVTGEITEESGSLFMAQLLELERLDSEAPVYVHMNTVGGSVIDALAIYDTMRSIDCPVIVNIRGLCASAGVLLLAGGDYRYATENSMFFYHPMQMSGVDLPSPEHLQATTSLYEMLDKKYISEIKSRSNIDEETWTEHFRGRHALWFDTGDALKWGLIHGTIKAKTKKKIQLRTEDFNGKERQRSPDQGCHLRKEVSGATDGEHEVHLAEGLGADEEGRPGGA